jgi:hypothetical protein
VGVINNVNFNRVLRAKLKTKVKSYKCSEVAWQINREFHYSWVAKSGFKVI